MVSFCPAKGKCFRSKAVTNLYSFIALSWKFYWISGKYRFSNFFVRSVYFVHIIFCSMRICTGTYCVIKWLIFQISTLFNISTICIWNFQELVFKKNVFFVLLLDQFLLKHNSMKQPEQKLSKKVVYVNRKIFSFMFFSCFYLISVLPVNSKFFLAKFKAFTKSFQYQSGIA